ncbi:MAG: hypothetical protein ACLUD2_09465 [Clostridium sp.]
METFTIFYLLLLSAVPLSITLGGFVVSNLVRVYKSINNGRGETMTDYPYASVFGLMLGFYVVLQLLHVADLCAHD